MKHPINIEVTQHNPARGGQPERLCVSWQDHEGFRYHYWCGPDLEPEWTGGLWTTRKKPTIYKNPSSAVPGFPTRDLDASAACNAKTVAAVRDFVVTYGLVDQARLKADEDERAATAKAAEEHRRRLACQAGQRLLTALRVAKRELERLAFQRDIGPSGRGAITQADAAIAEAEGRRW